MGHSKKFGKHILRSFSCLLLSALILLTASAPTYAKLPSSYESIFKENSLLFWNPEEQFRSICTSGGWSGGTISISGTTAAEKVWSGLTSFLTDEQAAGVMGNMASESGFNPARHEIAKRKSEQPGFDLFSNSYISYGIGLIQWSFGRRVSFMNFIQSSNSSLVHYLTDYSNYDDVGGGDGFISRAGDSDANALYSLSIEFLKSELDNKSHYNGIYQQTTVESATEFFLSHVEVPSNPDLAHHPERLTQAQSFYNQFHGKTISGGGSSSSISCSSYGNNNSAFTEYVLKYAWPTYHNAPYLDKMPAYATAVSTHKAAGKYVGGGSNPGIDCGGFVTILMQDSGFEPNYNSDNGNTSTQENWVKSHWTALNSPQTIVDTSILQAGDVAFTDGHTFVYVGDINGFDSKIASASYGNAWRAPMAGTESLTKAGSEIVRWYRKTN